MYRKLLVIQQKKEKKIIGKIFLNNFFKRNLCEFH